MNHIPMWTLAAAGVLTSLSATAADDGLKALREEIAQMKQAYEQRIAALETRLKEAEKTAAAGTERHDHEHDHDHGADGLDPEISLILQGRARKARKIGERAISGYWPAGHDHDGERRGLSIEHTELVLAGDVDRNFRGSARFAVAADGGVEVEEASFATLGLPRGLAVRGGRFLSDIGYLNARHSHEWDFADAPLMQQALFGEHGYRQDGVRVKWTAPAAMLLELGAEIGRGAAFPGTDRDGNGVGAGALFARIGDEVEAAHGWRAGLSWLTTRAGDRETHFEDTGANEVTGLFSGRGRTAIADFVWKWTPGGNSFDRHFKFQTEIFRRTERGTLACTSDVGASPCSGGAALGGLVTRQSGGYAQAVYRFMPHWRVGYRRDWLGGSGKSYDAATVFAALDPANAYFADHRPRRDSAMIDWSPTEFSRLRLQYARDRSMQGVADNQMILQYVMTLGAHGAHGF